MTETTIFSGHNPRVYLLTSSYEGRHSGMIATWVMTASLIPEYWRVVLALSPCNHTTGVMLASGRLAIHLLASEQFELVARFGLHSSSAFDKFAGLDYSEDSDGVPILAGCCGWTRGQVISHQDERDRLVVVARIDRHQHNEDKQILTMNEVTQRSTSDTLAALTRQYERDIERDRELLRRAE